MYMRQSSQSKTKMIKTPTTKLAIVSIINVRIRNEFTSRNRNTLHCVSPHVRGKAGAGRFGSSNDVSKNLIKTVAEINRD